MKMHHNKSVLFLSCWPSYIVFCFDLLPLILRRIINSAQDAASDLNLTKNPLTSSQGKFGLITFFIKKEQNLLTEPQQSRKT